MKEIATNLVCTICKKILSEPVSLSCNCTVCKCHLDDLCKSLKRGGNSLITCPSCQEEFHVPKQGFKINKLSKVIIDTDEHLMETEKELKTMLGSLLVDFENLVKKLKKKEREFSLFQFDYYAEIRRQIDLRKEMLKLRVDEIADEMIEQVNQSEKKYKEKTKSIQTKYKESDVQKEKQICSDIFRDPSLAVETVCKIRLLQDAKILELTQNLRKFEDMREELKSYTFTFDFEFNTNSFGYLKLNDDFTNLVTCSDTTPGLNVWDIKQSMCVQKFSEKVSCLRLHKKSQLLAGYCDGSIKLWDLVTGLSLRIFRQSKIKFQRKMCLIQNETECFESKFFVVIIV